MVSVGRTIFQEEHHKQPPENRRQDEIHGKFGCPTQSYHFTEHTRNRSQICYCVSQIVCLAIVGVASAGLLPTYPQPSPGSNAIAAVLKSDSQINDDGSYSYEYETSNGIHGQESGVGGKEVHGSVSYIGQDGQPIQLSYVADENGFHPTGAHLPISPPVPEAIGKRMLFSTVAGEPIL